MKSIVLADIAARINAEHKAATDLVRSAVKRACSAGELLLEAKAHCPHGMWLPWLKGGCPEISPRTAQAYMAVARHCLDHPANASRLQELTLNGALRQLASPKSAVAAHLMPWDGDDVSWLPDGGAMVRAQIEGAPDCGPVFVQESARCPGYFHMFMFFDGTQGPDSGGIYGLTKPVLAQAATAIFRRQFGKDPCALSWTALDVPAGEADEFIEIELPPPWLQEARERLRQTA